MTATKTFWMSFCDTERPKGDQFLGVAVIDVTANEALAIKAEVDWKHPKHLPDAEWLAAAARKAWAMGCNPGGEVASYEMPREWPDFDRCPRNVLLNRDRLTELDLA